jgi:broad specificity phosphatase PhoE
MSSYAPLDGPGRIDAIRLRDELNLFDKFVVSSPYPRALETACIFANGHPMDVDVDLHEWLPSKSFTANISDFEKINKAYLDNNGELPKDGDFDYETKQELKERMQRVIDRYTKVGDKFVFVCHARLISAFLDCKEPDYCEIIKYEFEV